MKKNVRRLRSLAILAAMTAAALVPAVGSANPPICEYDGNCYIQCNNDCGGMAACLAVCVDTYCKHCP
jgi:hypothetical protein